MKQLPPTGITLNLLYGKTGGAEVYWKFYTTFYPMTPFCIYTFALPLTINLN